MNKSTIKEMMILRAQLTQVTSLPFWSSNEGADFTHFSTVFGFSDIIQFWECQVCFTHQPARASLN